MIVLVIFGRYRWAFGLLVGAGWSIANFLLLVNVLKIALLQKSKAKLTAVLMLKFPVLYLAGFAILIKKIFPVWSLLSGLASI